MIRTYSELIQIPTFEERFEYLKLDGRVGESTFGFDRYLNQKFYNSQDWKTIRNYVIVRDEACDLGIKDREIYGVIIVHHMNPISVKDLENNIHLVLDPEYLICVSSRTHNAITFGNKDNLIFLPKERKRGDTKLW